MPAPRKGEAGGSGRERDRKMLGPHLVRGESHPLRMRLGSGQAHESPDAYFAHCARPVHRPVDRPASQTRRVPLARSQRSTTTNEPLPLPADRRVGVTRVLGSTLAATCSVMKFSVAVGMDSLPLIQVPCTWRWGVEFSALDCEDLHFPKKTINYLYNL